MLDYTYNYIYVKLYRLKYSCLIQMIYTRTAEEARRQLHKNVASNIEQVLAVTPPRHQLYGRLSPITKTIQVRRTRHAGHCWRSKNELISDVMGYVGGVCNLVISVDCSLNYSHHKTLQSRKRNGIENHEH